MYNIEKIYEIYKKEIQDCKSSLAEDEVTDLALMNLAKALTATIYRNGKIEYYHATLPDLTDEVMKDLNINICNRMYSLLRLLLSKDESAFKLAMTQVLFGSLCTTSWNNPEVLDAFSTQSDFGETISAKRNVLNIFSSR